jgi:murein DD-endopeptidase MepM/ murein hydrolase activator NlpD
MNAFSDYLETISQVNGLGNAQPVQWLFHSGMLFSTRDKWWGDFKFRQSVHEGIDITYFRTIPDELRQFDTSIKVPAMADGVIVNICDDFLGQTLVVEHENSLGFNRRILFVYAHIIPEKNLKPGHIIKRGATIARVCDTHKNPQLPPHLHFSCFEVSHQVQPEQMNWDLFSKSRDINLIHPVFL